MTQANRTIFVFLVMAVSLIASFAITFSRGQRAFNAYTEVLAVTAQLQAVDQTRAALYEAEALSYSYLYSGRESDKARADQALSRVLDAMTELRTGALLPAEEVENFRKLADREMEFLAQSLRLRSANAPEAALALMQNVEGERAGEAALQMLKDWRESLVTRRSGLLERVALFSDFRSLVFLVCLITNLLFLVWAYHTLRQEMRQRLATADENERQRDLLAVTLASIGDAVIQTDRKGIITYLNAEAEKLTGWSLAEAQGQPCSKVFNIINEYSRRPVESPVDTVLATGNTVGLANHTLLIRRDGTEVPIDDSGAPIRRPGGRILGVVLVFRDFSAHKRAEEAIQVARDEQAAANHAKDHFIAALSHELRTPLTPVLATLKLLERSETLPAGVLPDVLMMRRNIEMETRLIDDLLDLTRIEKGKMPLKEEVVDAHLLLAAVESIFRDELFHRGGDFTNDYAAAQHHVRVDPARFQQVLWNLLGNSLKFTPEGRNISVRTSNVREGELTITFMDEGIGMTPDTAARIFLPFEQGNADNTRRTRGLGLGLAIAKSIVEAHGGRMEGSSPGPQRGSTFLVHLPTVEPTVEEAQSAAPPIATAEASAPPAGTRRLLLVEDHEDTAQVITRVLRGSGYEVTWASSVAEALEIARENGFNVILSDLGLKDGSGLDFMRELRKFSAIPSIALTGFGMKEDVDKCREAGFTDHLTKPVDIDQLLQAIQKVITGETPPQGLGDL